MSKKNIDIEEEKIPLEEYNKLKEENERLKILNEFVAFYREYLTGKNMVVEMVIDYTHRDQCPESQYCPLPLKPSVSFDMPILKILEKVGRSQQIWVYNLLDDDKDYQLAWDLKNWTVGAEDYYKWRKEHGKQEN